MDIRRRACPRHRAGSGGKSCLLRFPPLPLTCGARGGGVRVHWGKRIYPRDRGPARPAEVAPQCRTSVPSVGASGPSRGNRIAPGLSGGDHETAQSLFLATFGVNLKSQVFPESVAIANRICLVNRRPTTWMDHFPEFVARTDENYSQRAGGPPTAHNECARGVPALIAPLELRQNRERVEVTC